MLDLPLQLFDDLVSAFAQDTRTTRYGSWDEVLDYCRRSANPIGRLVLRIGGYREGALDRSSDALCTALQLTNFWQDFGRDWRNGRLYVPRDVQEAEGADESQLSAGALTLADAVNRIGGAQLVSEFVPDTAEGLELPAMLLRAMAGHPE